MILEIDLGNTFAKWRLRSGENIVARGRVVTNNLLYDKTFCDALRKQSGSLGRICLASVLTPEETDRLATELGALAGVQIQVAQTTHRQAGLVNSYAEPARMGVDRWLAMLAALHRPETVKGKQGCLVISCGTAVTLDRVAPDGRHLGGYILPGLHLMRDALLSGTGRVKYEVEAFSRLRSWGTSTQEAVEHGAVHALASSIEQACLEHTREQGGCVTFLSGGDAGWLVTQLCLDMSVVSCHHIDDLVLDGLRFACPESG